jgi:hypothetical protein
MLSELDPLLLAYSFSVSTPPDQAKHYCGLSDRQVYTAFARCRKAAAHAYQHLQKDVTFADGEVEMDMTCFPTDRSSDAQ